MFLHNNLSTDNVKINSYNDQPTFIKRYYLHSQSMSEDYLFQHCTCIYFKNSDAKIVEEMDRNRIQFKLDTKSINEIPRWYYYNRANRKKYENYCRG